MTTPLPKAAEHLRKRFGTTVELSLLGDSLHVEGALSTWAEKVEAGWAAAEFGYRGVVNDIRVAGLAEETLEMPPLNDTLLDGTQVDVAIIGGGVIGTAIARELSKWALSIIVLEKEHDVGVHTSSRNDGMIHDGFAAKPGTLKATYNVRGNRLWEPLCRELDIEFKRPGSLVLFGSPATAALYPLMAERARRNGVDGWERWSRERVAAAEPFVTQDQHGALFLPSTAIISPYMATVALAESAISNGVRICTETCAWAMECEHGAITAIKTNRGTLKPRVVVNAAGNWADVVAAMAGDRFFSLHQRRGTECILDKSTAGYITHVISKPRLMQAKQRTKGGGLVPTLEGNILVGPTASEHPGREDYTTKSHELDELKKHLRLNVKLDMNQIITYFCGVRPCTYEEDFIIESSRAISNLVHVAGIQSPGLASAPAIAVDVAAMVVDLAGRSMAVHPKAIWIARREGPVDPKRLSLSERSQLIASHGAYGKIVCRCEEVSEGEVVDALHGVLPATSTDAVKRRTRAGMGRCHGGFCTARVIDIIARETNVPPWQVHKKGTGSEVCLGSLDEERP